MPELILSGEVSRRTGVPVGTLNRWVRLGVIKLSAPARKQGARALWSPEDVRLVRQFKGLRGRRAGLTNRWWHRASGTLGLRTTDGLYERALRQLAANYGIPSVLAVGRRAVIAVGVTTRVRELVRRAGSPVILLSGPVPEPASPRPRVDKLTQPELRPHTA